MAYDNKKIAGIMEQVFQIMPQLLDERQRRLLAASIAKGYGHGGIKLVSDASGMDIRTIRSGIREINSGMSLSSGQDKIRKGGAGRKPVKQLQPGLLDDIEAIVENNTYGDPKKSDFMDQFKPVRYFCSVERAFRHYGRKKYCVTRVG